MIPSMAAMKLTIFFGEAGADALSGGAGNDWLYFDADDTLVDGGADFDRAVIVGSSPVNLLSVGLTNVELVYGAQTENDIIDASGLSSRVDIQGQGGNDTITGTAFNDILRGDAGNDIINGGDGIDSLHGSAGIDTIHGGNGIDLVYGYAGADLLFGDAGNDYLYFDTDDTVVDGGADFDRAYFAGGAVDLAAIGMVNVELLYGHDGLADILDASGITDNIQLDGQGGADILVGGTGNNYLVGGAQTDMFAFDDNFGSDTIADFANDGLEKIDFTGNSQVNGIGDVTITFGATNTTITTVNGIITLSGITSGIDVNDFNF